MAAEDQDLIPGHKRPKSLKQGQHRDIILIHK